MRNIVVGVCLALVLVACGGAGSPPSTSSTTTVVVGETTTQPVEDPPLTTAGPTGSGSSRSTVMATTVTGDFAIFLAAVDVALAGTSYDGVVLGDADVFVAIGQLMCERLDVGVSAEDTLSEFLDALQIEGTVAADDTTATGVVFGAAIETICPQHADILG